MIQKVNKEQLRVPAHIDYLADLRDFVSKTGRKYHLSDKLVKPFKLAIDEAATNIIRYAYRHASQQGYITIRAIIRKQTVTFSLIDQGQFFDPNRVRDPDLGRYVEIGKKGGLGIFIMRRLMDEIEYRKTEEGNELRLTKNRPIGVRSRLTSLFPSSFRSLPFSLKIRFWSRSSAIIAAGVGLIYFYYYFSVAQKTIHQRLNVWNAIGTQIIHNVVQPQILQDLTGNSLHVLLNSYIGERSAEFYEIAVVDSTGEIIGHSVWEKTFRKYAVPEAVQAFPDMPNLVSYSQISEENSQKIEIYDYALPIRLKPGQARMGELHLRIYKKYVDQLISAQRWQYAKLAFLISILSSAGIFLLIYLIMNPLRKLADWVRNAGHGEIQDSIEIDPTSEVGEIAQAFTEITTKFLESQKNLAEQERLQQEMQVAQEIQQTLLPQEFPNIEGYEIAGHYEAAQLIGGDYYDFVEVDRDTLGIVVADVSGKGVPGSMVMTMIRQALRTEARGIKNAAEVLARLNELVMGDMKKGMFVTVFYVIIDSKRRRLNYASAGHNPMILYRATTQKTYYLNPRGFPIGIQLSEPDLFRKSIESDTIQLAEDDLLLLYTDGITEAMNTQRQIFGEERLLQTIRNHGRLRATPFVETLRNEILGFTEECPQSDDITFVVIREKTSMQKEELRRAKNAYKLIMAGTSIRRACETAGISTFTYYNKYKREFEKVGTENYEIEANISVEAKHISVEDKAKVFDIIKNHPEYGAKRISDELDTEKYNYTQISENKIYDELVRLHLNTRQLREAFVARGLRKHSRPIKPPGTPMLTLDGRVIIDSHLEGARPAEYSEDLEKPQPVAYKSTEPPPEYEQEGEPVADEEAPGSGDADQFGPEKASFDIVEGDVSEKEPDWDASESLTAIPGESSSQDETEATEENPLEESFSQMLGAQSSILEEETSTSQDMAEMATDGEMPIAEIDELLNEENQRLSTLTTEEGEDKTESVNERETSHSQEIRSDPLQIHHEAETTKTLDLQEQMLIEGFRLYKKKQFDEAINAFQKIVKLYPEYKEAYRILANAYFRLAQYDLAAETYLRIKTLDPKDTFAYENMGIVYTKKGQFADAVREWQKLLEIDPTREDIRRKIQIFEQKLDQETTL